MSDKEIYIIGAGTYGEAMHELAEESGYKIIGFYDDAEDKQGTDVMDKPVLGKASELDGSEIADKSFIVAIGNNKIRCQVMDMINHNDGNTPTLIHPSAIVSKYATIGKGCYIQAGTYVWTKVKINDYTIVSPGVVIAHHTYIGKGCLISTNSSIGADIIVEDEAFIGIGSTIMTGVKKIGSNTTIGAGAVVLKDLPAGCTAVGVPAKIINGGG